MAPLLLCGGCLARLRDQRGLANGGEWVAQLVRECGQELIFATVRFAQGCFGPLASADLLPQSHFGLLLRG